MEKEVNNHMISLICLLVGLLLGGCAAGTLLCCMQLNRVSRYEQEIRKLKEQLNK